MTSLSCRFLLGLGLALAAWSRHSIPADRRRSPWRRFRTSRPAPSPARSLASAADCPRRPARADHRSGPGFQGKAGISVVSLSDGWQADYNATTLFPQQSCSKLWVAITAMDAGRQGPGQPERQGYAGPRRPDPVPPADQRTNPGRRPHDNLGTLLFTAITESDNTANDKLMRSIGGPQAVRDMIAAKGLGSIRFYEGERALQSRIAGLIWSQSYSVGDAFYKARGALPLVGRARPSFERICYRPL